MATKLSPAMIAMIVEASHFRHHEIIGGNSRTLQAVIDRGLAEVKVNTTGGANTVHLTPAGYDTAVAHRPTVEPVEDIVTVTEVVSQADMTPVERFAHLTADMPAGERELWRAAAAGEPTPVEAAETAMAEHGRDDADVRAEVIEIINASYAGEDVDVTSLTDAIVKNHGVGPVANIPSGEFWAMVAEHDAALSGPTPLHTSDRVITDGWEVDGRIEWTREIRNVYYAFTMVRLPDGRIRTTATREDYYGTDDATGKPVTVTRERLHTIVTGEAKASTEPRGLVDTIEDSTGVVRTWERVIAGQLYRFILGASHTNGAVAATAYRVGTDDRIRVIPFRTAPSVAETTIHVGTWRESCASHGCPGCKPAQPPVITLPPRTIARGMRSVPCKHSKRARGWHKAGKASKGGKR